MYVTLKDLMTEVQYRNHPSVDEQMLLFHTGPMDIASDTIETTKTASHSQQAMDAVVVPTSAGVQQGLGDVESSGRPRSGMTRSLFPVLAAGVGVAAGLALSRFLWKRRS